MADEQPVPVTPPSSPLRPDAAHLDEDPEACEDPVHAGDARHQHDLHAQAPAAEEG